MRFGGGDIIEAAKDPRHVVLGFMPTPVQLALLSDRVRGIDSLELEITQSMSLQSVFEICDALPKITKLRLQYTPDLNMLQTLLVETKIKNLTLEGQRFADPSEFDFLLAAAQELNQLKLRYTALSYENLMQLLSSPLEGLELDSCLGGLTYASFADKTQKITSNLKSLSIENEPQLNALDLLSVVEFSRIEAIRLRNAGLCDENVCMLTTLFPRLKMLALPENRLTNECISAFEKLEALETLIVAQNYFSNGAAEALQTLKNLKYANLSRNLLVPSAQDSTLLSGPLRFNLQNNPDLERLAAQEIYAGVALRYVDACSAFLKLKSAIYTAQHWTKLEALGRCMPKVERDLLLRGLSVPLTADVLLAAQKQCPEAYQHALNAVDFRLAAVQNPEALELLAGERLTNVRFLQLEAQFLPFLRCFPGAFLVQILDYQQQSLQGVQLPTKVLVLRDYTGSPPFTANISMIQTASGLFVANGVPDILRQFSDIRDVPLQVLAKLSIEKPVLPDRHVELTPELQRGLAQYIHGLVKVGVRLPEKLQQWDKPTDAETWTRESGRRKKRKHRHSRLDDSAGEISSPQRVSTEVVAQKDPSPKTQKPPSQKEPQPEPESSAIQITQISLQNTSQDTQRSEEEEDARGQQKKFKWGDLVDDHGRQTQLFWAQDQGVQTHGTPTAEAIVRPPPNRQIIKTFRRTQGGAHSMSQNKTRLEDLEKYLRPTNLNAGTKKLRRLNDGEHDQKSRWISTDTMRTIGPGGTQADISKVTFAEQVKQKPGPLTSLEKQASIVSQAAPAAEQKQIIESHREPVKVERQEAPLVDVDAFVEQHNRMWTNLLQSRDLLMPLDIKTGYLQLDSDFAMDKSY